MAGNNGINGVIEIFDKADNQWKEWIGIPQVEPMEQVGMKTEGGGETFNIRGENNPQASGEFSHSEGEGTQSKNRAEHAQGKFNKSNTNTIHSVGIGTGSMPDERKNAFEIMNDGKVYVAGIGGYDGTNPDAAKDLATEVNSAGGGGASDIIFRQW